MLEVELAALEGWSELGVVPGDAAARIRSVAQPPSAARVAELERETNHDVAAFVDAVAGTLGEDGRWFHFGLTSSDVLDTALALTVQDAGALVLEGLDRAFRAVVDRAEEHRDTLCMGRTHGVHAEPTTFGLKLAGWAFGLDRDRTRIERAVAGMRVGKLSGRGRPVRGDRPGGRADRVRTARARTCAELDADPPARPPRRAAVRARAARLVARPLRDGDPAPRAHRGTGGRGAVRAWAEGVVGDAAQAEPDHGRADLRPRACRAGERAGRARERRALARARHLALLRRARRASRLVPRDRLHARPLRVAGRGPRRPTRADARQRRCRERAVLQSAAALRARRERDVPGRRVPARTATRDARLGGGARLPGARSRGRRPGRDGSTSTACSRSMPTPLTFRRCSTACVGSRRHDRLRCMPEALHLGSGKVRELYALGDDRLVLVASDRISTFDVVLPTEIPDKGRVLTGPVGVLVRTDAPSRPEPSRRACARTAARSNVAGSRCFPSRSSSAATSRAPAGRTIARRARSAVRDFLRDCGESDRLPEPIVTPATKATEGHDVNITERDAEDLCGRARYRAAREAALAVYRVRRTRMRNSAESSSRTRSSSSASTATAS